MSPLVSVKVAAYNHERYIAQCIEGILMQKTDFPFEIIIGEDCSTDRTRQIVLAYQEKYPAIIRILLSDQNIGAGQNILRIQQACRGKYGAMCEGDDYWIDPLKLQKQVDLMEAHPDLSMCFHNALILNDSTAAAQIFFAAPPKAELDFADVCWIKTPTASVMARNDILNSLPAWRTDIWSGDLLARLWCAHHGHLGYIDEIMSVYRVHAAGVTAAMHNRQAEARKQEVFLYEQLDKETGHKHTTAIQAQLKRVEARYRRNRQGWRHFLTNPPEITRRFQGYMQAMKRHRSVMWFGDES